MVMMKNMSEVSTVTLNRRVSNTKNTLVMMMALLAMLYLVVLLLMLTTTQTNNSSLNQAKRRLSLQNEEGKDQSWSLCARLDPRVYFEILDNISQHGTYCWTKGEYRFYCVV